MVFTACAERGGNPHHVGDADVDVGRTSQKQWALSLKELEDTTYYYKKRLIPRVPRLRYNYSSY
jgi:hypothetical protein